jgi:hypothetical protein
MPEDKNMEDDEYRKSEGPWMAPFLGRHLGMDDKAERKRLQHLEAVQRYFAAHKGELKHVGMTWPLALLKRIDEAAAAEGVSRRAWLLALCGRELGRLTKKRKRKPG